MICRVEVELHDLVVSCRVAQGYLVIHSSIRLLACSNALQSSQPRWTRLKDVETTSAGCYFIMEGRGIGEKLLDSACGPEIC